MIKEAIVKIVDKCDLSYDEAYTVMNEIMSGQTTATQNAAFLAALSTKSARAETTDEISGCAAAMREHALKVDIPFPVFEIVGTGGDNAHSFNISTTSAIVAAAGGVKVAKHGNRAASSSCGTGGLPRSFGRKYKPESREMHQASGNCRNMFFLRAKISYFHEIRRRDKKGTRFSHRIQYIGTAHQPRFAENAASGRIRRVSSRAPRRRAHES